MNKYKICLVIPPYLPVPAVKGGAVETLTESILELNEKYSLLDIDCITIYNKKAEENFKKYPNTNFLTFRVCNNLYIANFLRTLNYIIRKVFKVDVRRKIRDKKYNKLIRNKKYDYVIFEGVNPHINKKIVDMIGKEKLILHIHKNTLPTKDLIDYYQYFIGISKYVSNSFCNGNTISKDRIFTLYNGIDLNKFDRQITTAERKELRNKYLIEKDEIVILYTGRLLPEKGVKELITAFMKIKDKNNVKLLIVGSANSGSNSDTVYTKELKNLAKNESKIIFTGYVDNNNLYKYYQISDVAVFPSTCEEGFGLVLVEAMCSKLPVIITNSGGMKEIVNDNNAVKIDIDNDLINNLSCAIDKICKDEALRERMGLESYKLSRQFSIDNYYKGYVKILNEIKNGGRAISE